MSKGSIQFDFSGKRVLITGGTSGMGEASALAFAAAGANVVINGRNQQKAAEIIKQAEAFPGNIQFISADIVERTECDRVVEAADGLLGGLDIVVNSAGIIYHATAEETTDDQWLDTMNINVNAMFYICRAAIPHLRKTQGTIINIASDASLSGSYHMTAFAGAIGGHVITAG